MKKYIYVIVLIVLPILSATFVYMQKPQKEAYYLMNLEGESKHWKIENATIFVKPDNSFLDGGSLSYLGNAKDIVKGGNVLGGDLTILFLEKKPNQLYSKYLNEIVKEDPDLFNDKKVVSTQGGTMVENVHTFQMTDYDKKEKSTYLSGASIEINSTHTSFKEATTQYVMVHWKTKDGKEHDETIELGTKNKDEISDMLNSLEIDKN